MEDGVIQDHIIIVCNEDGGERRFYRHFFLICITNADLDNPRYKRGLFKADGTKSLILNFRVVFGIFHGGI